MRLFLKIFLFAFLLGSGLIQSHPAFATSDGVVLLTSEKVPRPSPQVMARWKDDLYGQDELVFFKDRATFQEFLKANPLGSDLEQELNSAFKESLSSEEYFKAVSFHGSKQLQKSGFLFLSDSLWEKLPQPFIQALYERDYLKRKIKPVLYIREKSMTAMESVIDKWNVSPTDKALLLKSTIILGRKTYFLITPRTWKIVPDSVKEKVIASLTAPNLARRAVGGAIRITKENITTVAKKYAGERNPQEIEAYLNEVLSQTRKDYAYVDLEDILHPFIKEYLGKFSSCSGPNCFSAGINANRVDGFKLEHTTAYDLREYLHSHYRFVKPEEELRAGDLLLYEGIYKMGKTKSITALHVATYIDEDLVFTKNGINKLSPYMLQRNKDNKELYFPDGRYRLLVFRIPGPGEKVINPKGNYYEKGDYYFEHPDLKFFSLKYRPGDSFELRKKSLRSLSDKLLSDEQYKNLIDLRDRPDAQDLKFEIQSLISRYDKLGGDAQSALRVASLEPFGHRTKNLKTLKKILDDNEAPYTYQRRALDWLFVHRNNVYKSILTKIFQKHHLLAPTLPSRDDGPCSSQLSLYYRKLDPSPIFIVTH